MAETDDLQERFDALAGEVARLAPGDAERPVRIARRRRRVRSGVAVAAVVAVVAGAIGVGVVARDDGGSGIDPADTGRDNPGSSGPFGRESLLRWLPADSSIAYVADVEAVTGTPGIDPDDPYEVAVSGYIQSSLAKLNIQPFGRAMGRRLLTFVGNASVDYRVLDLGVDRAEDLVRSAGWERVGDDVWTVGDGVGSVQKRQVAGYVRVQGSEGGPTLMMIGNELDDLPDVLGGGEPPEGSSAGRQLVSLDTGAGVALGDSVSGPCVPVAFALGSPTTATVLISPPRGQEPRDVTADQIARLDGVTGVADQSVSGDLVRAELEVESPSVPIDILERLGLPGTQIC